MSVRKTTEFGYVSCLLMVLFLLPFFYAAFYTFPGGDDFARAVKARHVFDVFGGIEELARAWWKWSGRYTHHFLIIFLGDAATGASAYALVCLGNMLLHLVSLVGICAELAGPCKKSTPLFLGLFLLLGLVCSHGTLPGTWYLLTDILSLGVASGFTLLYIWSLCVLWNADTVTRGKKIFCMASCIVAAGCYEYSAVMVVICSATAWLLAKIHRHRHTSMYFSLMIVSLVCFLLSFFARGNFRRQTKRDVGAELVVAQMGSAWGEWVGHVLPALVTPLHLCITLAAAWIDPRGCAAAPAKVPAWLVLLYCLAAAAAFMFALTIVHAVSDVPLSATPKIPANMSVFVAMIFAFGLLACGRSLRLGLLRKIPVAVLVPACLVVLCATPNMQNAVASIATGALWNYAAAQEGRKAWILRAGKGADVTVAPLGVCPYPSCQRDPLSKNPADWPGRHMAELYGLRSLRAVPASAAEAFARASSVPGFCMEEAEQTTGEKAERLTQQGAGQSAGQDFPLSGITRARFAARLSGGPNVSYVSDWLFLVVDETLVREGITASLLAVADTDPLARLGLLPAGDAYDKPGWIRFEGALPWYALSDPAYRVGPAGEGKVLLGLPVHTLGAGTVLAVYISLDGTRYYKVPVCESPRR